MAQRKKGEKESSYSYLRKLLLENPQWLNEKSNDSILEKYRADHGLSANVEVERTVKNNLANLKSNLRKKLREEKPGAKAPATVPASRNSTKLDYLEEMIDDCLTLAKNMDREGLHDVIVHLRKARNQVVWKIGM